MVFYILAGEKYLNLFVTTVNPDMPPEAYQLWRLAVTSLLPGNLNLMLKTENSTPLLHVLRRIDSFWAPAGCRYLLSDELTYADCQLMPKLHHVKMAGKAYYSAMYDCEAFRCSCPADRDLYQLYYDKLPRIGGAKGLSPSLMDDSRVLLGGESAAVASVGWQRSWALKFDQLIIIC
uniref:GST C-terminal domain-containing protein n=1 Tax=Macrostomum lignano TaxID=282301 RepID=A0A1I8FLJ6_9PLAT